MNNQPLNSTEEISLLEFQESSVRSNAVEVEEETVHSSSGYRRSARARSTRNSGGLGSGIGNDTGDELQTPMRQMRRTAKNEENIAQVKRRIACIYSKY